MDIQQAIASICLNTVAITGLVGQAIRPISAATIDVLPLLTYQVTGTETFDTFTGSASVRKVHFQFDIFALKYADAAAIAKGVRDVLHNYQGTIEDIRISLAKHTEDYDASEPPDIGQEKSIIRLASTYVILYRNV